MIRPTILDINKAKIILYPIKQFPSIHINILIRAGSWYETGPQWGAFHYLEHLIFKGSTKYPTNKHLENFKQEHGINLNGSTGGSDMSFWLSLPDFKLNQGLEIIDQFIFHPLFNPDQFKKEVSVITQEYFQFWNEPYNRFYKKFNDLIIGEDNFLNRHSIGQPEFIAQLSQSDLKTLHSQYFQPQNLIISFVGNLNPTETKNKITPILQHQTNNFSPKLPQTSIPQIKQKTLNYHDKIDQSYLIISWVKKKKLSFRDKVCLGIISSIISGNTNSILVQKIRQKLGLVYYINSSFSHSQDINFFEIWASTENKKLNQIIDTIQFEIKKFIQQGITTKKFNQIRQYMNYRTLMSDDSPGKISQNLSRQLFHHHKIYLPQDLVNIANKITLDDFMSVSRDLINPENTITATMTPTKPES